MSSLSHDIDPSGDVVLGLSSERRAPSETSPTEPTTQAELVPLTSQAMVFTVTCFKVSSKYLILASKYFRDHLKEPIPPTSTDEEPWHYMVPMLDCDPRAFLIVMNVIHGKGQQIPKEADAVMLLKIAAVIRYLDCLPACTFAVEVWIQRLLHEKKIVYDTWDNSLKWAYIGWAFRYPDMFTQATSAAMSWRCSSSKYPLELELPELIKGIVS
jgi:hypothetical protein